MHYGNLVIVTREDAEADLDATVEKVMGPSEKNGGFWDWYQIGGRWTGTLDGYEPEKDEANIKPCNLCGATGKRADMEVANGCNGCAGTGKSVEWPTQWKRHAGDVMPVEQLTEEQLKKFYRVVCDGYGPFGGERYYPWKAGTDGVFEANEMPPLDWLKKTFTEHVAVVVDNHSYGGHPKNGGF
jgi:hypothetical protein